MNTISKREKELFQEAWRLRNASFEISKLPGKREDKFNKSRELQERENEIYKKQQFFKNYIKEMEKIGK